MLVRYRQPGYRSLINNEFDRLISGTFGAQTHSPPADIATQGNDVVVTLEVPGLSADDIDITLDGRRLTISGERSDDALAEGDRVIARGSRRGRFNRTFTVPAGTTAEQVNADLENGLLRVRVAEVTKPEPRPQKIAIGQAAETPELESSDD